MELNQQTSHVPGGCSTKLVLFLSDYADEVGKKCGPLNLDPLIFLPENTGSI